MPILHHYYVDMDQEEASKQAPVRSAGWRAWWNGSAYANPVSGMIDRIVEGLENTQVMGSNPGLSYTIDVSRKGFEVQLPDDKVTLYPMDEVSDIVIHLGYDNGSFEGRNRNKLTFLHNDTALSFLIQPDHPAILNCIQLFLEHGIPYKEYVNQSRSFRLGTNMMYKDIQEMKEQWGIVW